MVRFGLALSLVSSLAFGVGAKPAFRRVFIVIFENTNYKDALKQPFLGKLAQGGASFSNFHAETHPSQGNYIALTSGDLHGVKGDGNYDLDVTHVGDLLEAKGMSWKVYAEGFPGNCFQGARSGTYYRKHNPFISYRNVQRSPERCARIVNADQLDADIRDERLPDYAFYVPDINNDGHDTGVKFADTWYGKAFGPRLADPRFANGTLLISTFDESASWLLQQNQIYTSFFGDSVVPGSGSGTRYDHYSVLHTIEEAFALGTLGRKDAKAAPITGIWR